MTRREVRLSLPATPVSAREARRFVDAALDAPALAAVAYPATMLVSELVANAILHSGTSFEVVVVVDGDRVRIEVHDGSPRMPVRKNYSALAGTGRGLMLVDRMAARWGMEPEAAGKVVWFELDAATARAGILGADAL